MMLTFTLSQAKSLVEMFGGDEESEIAVRHFAAGAIKDDPEDPADKPSPEGLWGYMAEYPEEGAVWLGPGVEDGLRESSASTERRSNVPNGVDMNHIAESGER